MKTVGIGMLLVLLTAFPAFAQEDAAPACTVDVTAVQDLLTQAASAEPEAAVALVAQAQAALDVIIDGCSAAGIYLLDQTFTASNNTFTVSYPHGWTLDTVTPSTTGAVLFMGSTSDPDGILQIAEPTLGGSEQALQLLVGVRTGEEGNLLEGVVHDFETLIQSMYTEISTTEYYTLEGYSAARLSFRSTGFDGVLVAVDLGSGRFAVARGVAAPRQLEAIRGVAEAVVLSVQ